MDRAQERQPAPPRPGARDTQALPAVQSVTLTLYEAGEAVGTWAG